jgi:hypothetical protein
MKNSPRKRFTGDYFYLFKEKPQIEFKTGQEGGYK